MLNVLIACEESQRVCIEMRRLGHRAFSCDILPCSGGHPEWHIQGDVLPLLNGDCTFQTMDGRTHTQRGRWDLIIAHPPCTNLAVSGARYFAQKQKDGRQQKSIVFFMQMALANCDHIAVENPVCIMSSAWRKPDQIIQPFQFGHPVSKKTCLWLKGLPHLMSTETVKPEIIHSAGKSGGYSGNLWHVKDENGKILSWSDPRTARARSKTFPGIARAMAEQWTDYIEKEKERTHEHQFCEHHGAADC